jgi:hypothetical protein
MYIAKELDYVSVLTIAKQKGWGLFQGEDLSECLLREMHCR